MTNVFAHLSSARPSCGAVPLSNRIGLRMWFLFLGLIAFTGLLSAQVDTGVIAGIVTDAHGAALVGAKITIKNINTNYVFNTETNTEGFYVSVPLPIGVYSIRAEIQGFRASEQQLTLTINQRAAVDFTMSVGAVTQQVTVTEAAAGAELETESSTLGTLRSTEELEDLPNNGRLWTETVNFSPGVVPAQSQAASNALSQVRGDTSSSVNGVNFEENDFLVDGIQDNETHQGYGIMTFPELEAVAEFQVATSAPDARYDRPGGTINATYKSGTNRFHGDAFEFIRNNAFDAKNYFEAGPKQPYHQNQFGGIFGGPIGNYNSHTFFFFSYQGDRLSTPTIYTDTVPTALERTGNFSEILAASGTKIYDPTTTKVNTNGTFTRTAYSGNIIPSGEINPVGQAIINLYPAPTSSGLTNNLYLADQGTTKSNQYTAKIDRDFSDSSHAFARVTWASYNVLEPGGASGGPPETPHVLQAAPSIQFVPSYTYIHSAHLVNQVRFGYSRENLQEVFAEQPGDASTQIGIPNINTGTTLTAGLPFFTSTGFTQLGVSIQMPAIVAMNNIQIGDNVTLVRGNHNIDIGGDAEWRQTNVFQVSDARADYAFTTLYTGSGSSGGSAAADMLLGAEDSVTLQGLSGTRGLRRVDYDGYIQDNWQVSSRLALNLGLRYDLRDGYPNKEVQNRAANWSLATGVSTPITGAGIADVKNEFMPRVGFAFKVDNKTSIHSAYGLYYAGEPLALGSSLAFNPPYIFSTTITNSQTNFTGANFFQNGPNRPAAVNSQYPITANENYNALDPNFILGRVSQYNLAVERELPFAQLLKISYVGTQGRHLFVDHDVNQAALGSGAVNSRRPFPNIGTVAYHESDGISNYNALQVQLIRRLTHGLQYDIAYTWSHYLDRVSTTDVQNSSAGFRQNYGNDSVNVPNDLKLTAIYDMPFGRGRTFFAGANGIENALISGWQLNGTAQLYSGIPSSVTASANTLNIGETVYANESCNPNKGGARTIKQWFNTACFTAPAASSFGTGRPGTVYGPPTRTMDLSLFRHFPITEWSHMEFRAEAFNLTNTPQFNNPAVSEGALTFGQISSAGSDGTLQRTERILQFGLKYIF